MEYFSLFLFLLLLLIFMALYGEDFVRRFISYEPEKNQIKEARKV